MIFTIVFGCFYCWLHLFTSSLFLQVFSFHHWFYYCFWSVFISPTFFTVTVFCQVLCFCVVLLRVLWIWESFFYSPHFLLHTPFWHLAQPAFIKASLEPAVQPWMLQGLSLKFKTQNQPICLFESHSILQKVLVGRFYLCIKTLQNTIQTSFRFWTRYLITICTLKQMSNPLGHRSS